jgi:ABC-2 type transport system permease protein
MLKDLRFALFAIKKNIQSNAELRASFIMNIFGMMLNNLAFVIVWVFFAQSVGVIGGWTAADIIGLQGFVCLSYGIIFSMASGLRKIPDYVASGAFDSFMLSPKNLLVRIATSSFGSSAIGDMVFGIMCLAIYGFLTHVTSGQILLIVILEIFSVLIFFGVTISVFSVSFLFADPNAVSESLFELFMTPMLFHGGAFQGATRSVFTFVIPSLTIGALPVEALKDISLDKLVLIGTIAIVWFVLSQKIFALAVRKYESSNFMTFGS